MSDRSKIDSEKGFFGGISVFALVAAGIIIFGMYAISASSGISYYAILIIVASAAFLGVRTFKKVRENE